MSVDTEENKKGDGDTELDNVKKKLELVNNSLSGKKRIDEYNSVEEILSVSSNSRTMLAKAAMELYEISATLLKGYAIGNEGRKQEERNIPADNEYMKRSDMEEIINTQLKNILPNIIKDAIANTGVAETAGKSSTISSVDDDESPKTQHVLVLENKDSGNISEQQWSTVVKARLKKVPVERVNFHKGTESVAIRVPNKETLDQAKDLLQGDFKVSATTKTERKLDPRIKVFDIDKDILQGVKENKTMVNDRLIDEIRNKNSYIDSLINSGGTMSVVLIDDNDGTAVLRMTANIRAAIKQNNDRIHLGLKISKVKDHFHIIQCYHCQRLGHMRDSKYCTRKNKDATCFYCAGPHRSAKCADQVKHDKTKHKCSNCLGSDNKHLRQNAHTHNATDSLCPFVIREMETLMKRTTGTQETKNEYSQRIKDLKNGAKKRHQA